MPLTPAQRAEIRRHALERAVPSTKSILESGGYVPDDMDDGEAWAEVNAVLQDLRREISEKIPV